MGGRGELIVACGAEDDGESGGSGRGRMRCRSRSRSRGRCRSSGDGSEGRSGGEERELGMIRGRYGERGEEEEWVLETGKWERFWYNQR